LLGHERQGCLRGRFVPVVWLCLCALVRAQSPISASQAPDLRSQVEALQSSLGDTRAELERSRQEVTELRRRLEELEARISGPAATSAPQASSSSAFPTLEDALKAQQPAAPSGEAAASQERQELLAAQVAEQSQTKVESGSRYKVKLSGLILMNTHFNNGAVDNTDLPGLALPQTPGQPAGDFAATLRQTVLGLEMTGPKLAGASTAADLQMDFFGGFPSYQYGVASGLVRLRTARASLDWGNTKLVLGQDTPFFSPLSPTSYASVGEPAFSWAGNQWVWTPQIRLEHTWAFSDSSGLTLTGGILDPLTEYIPEDQFNRSPSAGESSRQPAYAAHVAWKGKLGTQTATVGAGTYYSRQSYGFGRNVDAWEGTTDLDLPLGRWFAFSGEFYRGRALGGLGGGVWNSIVANGDPDDAGTRIVGLNTVGGWSQVKIKPLPKLEFNVAAGTDNPLASDLRIFPNPMGSEFPAFGRNQSLFANSIYRPRSNLILALEYRRLRTYMANDAKASADHINLAFGVAF